MGKMATISQINGNEVAGKEFYDYVRTEGAVLFSFNPDFSPAALYGGSWEKFTDRFLIGAGGSYTLGSTGGEANVTLTIAEMPQHAHEEYGIDSSSKDLNPMRQGSGGLDGIPAYAAQWEGSSFGASVGTGSTGSSQPHNNMPPYVAVNIWRKVA